MILQSATSIADFKKCPTLFFIRHILRLRPVETPEAARQGTNWHKCLEILTMKPGGPCECTPPDPNCPLCEGASVLPDDLRLALVRYMNKAYATCPPSIDLVKWETERTVLLYSAIGWQWHWQDETIETVAREVAFNRHINTMYQRRGRIDRIIRRHGGLSLGEYKSTSKTIDSGSPYWDRLNKDSQLTLYLIEARHAQLAGELEQYGISASDPLISGMLYDVWHKPTTKPKKLTQADTKKFMAPARENPETKVEGEYFGEKFSLIWTDMGMTGLGAQYLFVNDVQAIPSWGKPPKPTKKNPDPVPPIVIRETPEMFGARLLADIQEQPEKYFARKDIARTDLELGQFDKEFYNIARVADFMTRQDLWFIDESQCAATYRCSCYPICHGGLDITNGNVPEGFKCSLNKEKKNADTATENSQADPTEGPESSR